MDPIRQTVNFIICGTQKGGTSALDAYLRKHTEMKFIVLLRNPIDRGLYLDQLRRLWNYFSKRNILILKSEDLRQKPNEVLNNVCKFLGIRQFTNIMNKNVHLGPYVSSISEREREYLKSIFESHIKELEIELNWDCSNWLS